MKKLQQLFAVTLLTIASFGIAQAAEHEIKMLNNGPDGIMTFDPGFIKVNVGDTVTFVPTDFGHNTVSYFTPEGGVTWEGEYNKAVTITMNKEGVYIYDCVPHTAMAMVGVIQVGNATNLAAAQGAAKSLAKKFVMNKDRLDKYLAQVK